MTINEKIRRLALEEAELEFSESLMPPSKWTELNAERLKQNLVPTALEVLYANESGKKKALLSLMEAISEAETSPRRSTDSSAFLDKHGIDNELYWDENPNISVEQKLLQAILGRKQRPDFYFQVEELAPFLSTQRADEFRSALGA
jgi:hypothetical protein